MATINYRAPQLVGSGNIREPKMLAVLPAQNASFRRGDLVVQSTTGSITNPPSVGSGAGLASAAAPAASAVTIVNHAVTGAAAQTYYIKVTYTATGQETVASQEFVQNCPAGYVPGVTVAAAGAPAAATNFAAYVGILPGTEALQQATKTTTALGTEFDCAYPLTNSIGANRGATNLSSNILGLALADSSANYFGGVGGSFMGGQPGTLLGTTNTIPPLAPTDAYYNYVVGLGNGQLVEFSLNQNTAYQNNLLGSTAGLTLDSTSGIWTVDPTQSNKIFTITDFRQGVAIGPTSSGSVGDLGVRIIGYFNSGLLLQ